MTVAVVCKLSDGVILGVDSAVSIRTQGGADKIYEGADKLFRLGNRPIGIAVYGLGELGSRSIGSYLREFEVLDPEEVVSGQTTMSDVVEALRKFFLDRYKVEIDKDEGSLGLIVGGFSYGDYLSEVWHILIPEHTEPAAKERIWGGAEFGAAWRGASDPLRRYMLGYDRSLVSQLMTYFQQRLGTQFCDEVYEDVKRILGEHEYGVYAGAMPMQEGIEYTRWLVELVVNHYRFFEVQPIVGGAVRIGTVTYTGEQFRLLDPKVEHGG